jgi:drug/metabolite transporter (DMT)-like permease
MSRTAANLLLLVAGLVWGLGFVAQETAMDDIGPFTFMTLRFTLAALAVLPFAVVESRKCSTDNHLHWKDVRPAVLVAVMFFFAMMSQQVGILGTTVTNAGVLTGLYVVMTPLIALVVLGQRQPAIIWPSAVMALAGIWMLGGGGLDKLSWGDWLVIIGAVFGALHVLAMGHAVTGLRRPAAVASAQFAISGGLSAIGFAVARMCDWRYEPRVSPQTLLMAGPEILYAALFAGALAFTIMAICQQYTPPADAAVLLASEALFAAIAGAVLLNERLSLVGYCGGAMLFLAIVVICFAATRVEESSKSSV